MLALTLVLSGTLLALGPSGTAETTNSAEPRITASPPEEKETAVFAGGCFWGVEAVFERLHGVRSATSGYGVPKDSPTAEKGPAESVRVEFDPNQITYRQLLEVFFLVTHDPTQIDRQGPDVGPRYRSIVFVDNDEQRQAVTAFLDELRARRVFPEPIATEVASLRSFRIAEPEHQNFVRRNPRNEYVVQHDLPILQRLSQTYPALVRK